MKELKLFIGVKDIVNVTKICYRIERSNAKDEYEIQRIKKIYYRIERKELRGRARAVVVGEKIYYRIESVWRAIGARGRTICRRSAIELKVVVEIGAQVDDYLVEKIYYRIDKKTPKPTPLGQTFNSIVDLR